MYCVLFPLCFGFTKDVQTYAKLISRCHVENLLSHITRCKIWLMTCGVTISHVTPHFIETIVKTYFAGLQRGILKSICAVLRCAVLSCVVLCCVVVLCNALVALPCLL